MAARKKKSSTKKSSKKAKTVRRPWRTAAKWVAVCAIWCVILGGIMLGFYAHDLPDISGLGTIGRRPSIALADKEGKIFATFGEFHGSAVTVSELPPYLPQAVMAIEDRRFYSHIGVDGRGLARAVIANMRAGRFRQGGSTLTQQLAKILFLTPDRTIKRKVQELFLAFQLENRFTKDEIFSIYLNRVYLGGGAYGVEAAAQKYFGISAREVSLYQAAVLAGLLQAPSRYSPASDPEAAMARASQVLDAMVTAGYITLADRQTAETKGMGTLAVASSGLGKHFADWVADQISDYISGGDRDLVVQTTLDLRMQTIATTELATLLDNRGSEAMVGEAALVSLAPDGAVRAMVGGRDYDRSQFNRATQALRQPGSAFKPFVFLAGLEAGISPDAEFEDQPIQVDGWRPGNFDGRFLGRVTVREAVARSINTIAVQVSEKAGRLNVIHAARRLGISSPLPPNPSIALGTAEVSPLELAGAYATFAAGGMPAQPYAIQEIRDGTGAILYQRQGSLKPRIITAEVMTDLNDLW
ncbi:MAG: transglycosylase domain-containing protein [Alphaproteobacteria bacterium]